jgi:hypothetical protein
MVGTGFKTGALATNRAAMPKTPSPDISMAFIIPSAGHLALGYKSHIKFEDEAKRETMALH